jgi:hypothetical protein
VGPALVSTTLQIVLHCIDPCGPNLCTFKPRLRSVVAVTWRDDRTSWFSGFVFRRSRARFYPDREPSWLSSLPDRFHDRFLSNAFQFITHNGPTIRCYITLLTTWKTDSHSVCQTISCFLYGTRRFVTVLTKACHRTLYWASRIHWVGGWVGPRAVLDSVVERKISSPHRESNSRTPIVQPVTQRYTDWAITAHPRIVTQL